MDQRDGAWTSVQVRELKTMARKKTPASRIAKKFKRTEGATRQKAFSIGLSRIRARKETPASCSTDRSPAPRAGLFFCSM